MSTALVAAAVLIVIAVLAVLWIVSRRKKAKPWIQLALCPRCGWQGQTSRFAGRCPRCNTPIGDQRGQRTR